jgi:hypothetical protein
MRVHVEKQTEEMHTNFTRDNGKQYIYIYIYIYLDQTCIFDQN